MLTVTIDTACIQSSQSSQLTVNINHPKSTSMYSYNQHQYEDDLLILKLSLCVQVDTARQLHCMFSNNPKPYASLDSSSSSKEDKELQVCRLELSTMTSSSKGPLVDVTAYPYHRVMSQR